mmetsp:Transcript_76797/g.178131  ORF Transcript_76797/g.178131 Transcript_76797/m.178131 type:complete len:176 (-) Transcript_76797:72-599(-)|eukprot:CAMPEP_0171099870 /NCGR_PEP_ID=MMETSP0766_2-20121228/52620_1 /TAXON_ID=439317 /ORGANISM="Gambierdiscus australes, Strain CAWD 149" /LENGTH=175 /DNA_ID=CAMNT_0011559593 /DNA_START=76 /DNA_END=603 /DNA_ORIENTATION=-
MPVRIIDEQTIKDYFPADAKPAKAMSPEMELLYLCSVGKSTARLERCLKRNPDVNRKNEMGVTPLMFACSSWSVPFVQKLLDEKADPNLEDKNGVTAMNIVNDSITLAEEKAELERIDCRKRRLEMEITGTLMYDRPNVEELEPFNEMYKLYEIKKIMEKAGAMPGANIKRPGYD